MVYKVTEFQGTARMKFSEEVEKLCLPGAKSTFRVYLEEGTPAFDLLCLASEVPQLQENSSDLEYFTKDLKSEVMTAKPASLKLLTKALYGVETKGRVEEPIFIKDQRDQVLATLKEFGGPQNLIYSEDKYRVYLSKGLWELFCTKYNELVVSN